MYQSAADGQVRRMPPDTGTPFMAVTFFDADQVLDPPPDQAYGDRDAPGATTLSGGGVLRREIERRTLEIKQWHRREANRGEA